MKQVNCLALLAAGALCIGGLAGCQAPTRIVDLNADPQRVSTLENIDPQDWITAVTSGANSLLSSDALAECTARYGEKPLIMVSVIRNKTQKHIDTQLLTERLTEAILNSRQARITSAVAADGSQDLASKQLRDLEFDEDFDQSSVMQRGTLQSPNVSLSGVIIQQSAKEGRLSENSYFFDMLLTDNRTGEVIWKYSREIVKQKNQSWFGF